MLKLLKQMHYPMFVEAISWPQPKLCSVAISWGILSAVDLESEFLRWLGSIRFQIMFLYLLIRKLA